MANRKNWLGMLVMALVFGVAVIGCTITEGTTTTTSYSDGTRTVTHPDGTKTVSNIYSDGKGGVINIKNTGSHEYWHTSPLLPNTKTFTQNRGSFKLSGGQQKTFTLDEDGEYEIFFREVRTGETNAPLVEVRGSDANVPVVYEQSSLWFRRSVYVSNDETSEIDIQ